METNLIANDDSLLDEKSTFGYCIPFKRSLEKILNIIPVEKNLKFKPNLTRFKSDIFDGKYIKEIIDTKVNKNQLVFLLYNDDVELTNPIGSNRIKHKIS